MSKVTLSEDLKWRGQIKDKTFEKDTWLDKPRVFYLGADVGSADSLTVGNLAVYMLARRLVKAGWKPIMLVGGATSLIGDPGGKTQERDLVSKETVEKNKKAIASQVKNLFGGIDFKLVDNYEWFKDIGYLEFLRDVGKHYSMTELLQRDFITARIGASGSGISYAEFSYSLIQGYDYWYLFKKHNVELQIGGSDQWGNMLSGVPLVRKKENAEVHALSMPLVIDKTTGKKFGKSEAGAIWLDENKTSVYQFYQFWLNVGDDSVSDYLKIYTELDKTTIALVMAEFEGNRKDRYAQKTLAYEVTKLVHGKDKADSVKRATETLFGSDSYTKLTLSDVHMLKSELPQTNAKLGKTTLVEVLVNSGLAKSNSEARRYLSEQAVYINGLQNTTDKKTLEADDVIHGHAIIRRGKNTQAVVQIAN